MLEQNAGPNNKVTLLALLDLAASQQEHRKLIAYALCAKAMLTWRRKAQYSLNDEARRLQQQALAAQQGAGDLAADIRLARGLGRVLLERARLELRHNVQVARFFLRGRICWIVRLSRRWRWRGAAG